MLKIVAAVKRLKYKQQLKKDLKLFEYTDKLIDKNKVLRTINHLEKSIKKDYSNILPLPSNVQNDLKVYLEQLKTYLENFSFNTRKIKANLHHLLSTIYIEKEYNKKLKKQEKIDKKELKLLENQENEQELIENNDIENIENEKDV